MSSNGTQIPYPELAALADRLFEESDDDVGELVRRLDAIDPVVRRELLVSDLLNAYQSFCYFFRTVPDELIKERLELEPASSLVSGIKIDEIDLLELIFSVRENKALIIIGDGENVIRTFEGRSAFTNATAFMTNPS